MKHLIIKLLDSLGLVTAGRYRVVVGRLRDVESQAKKLTKLIDAAKAETKSWRTKAEEMSQQLKAFAKDEPRRAREAEKLKLEGQKRVDGYQRELARMAGELERVKKQNIGLESLRAKLAEAEHQLALAREQLMAIDVKLDILEGAANVLDARTRTAVAKQAGERNASV